VTGARYPVVGTLLGLLAGCGGRPMVETLMQFDACQGLSEGVEEVEFERLATIRRMEFLTDEGAEEDDGDYRLIAIAAALQSRGGYAVTLTDAVLTDHGLQLETSLEAPNGPPRAGQDGPSRPCLVLVTTHLDLPVTARLDAKPLGTLPPARARSNPDAD
jgi:hypothetical protein